MTTDRKLSADSKHPYKNVTESKNDSVKAPDSAQGQAKASEITTRSIEITNSMTSAINSSKELIAGGCSKMDSAKEAYDLLSGYSRGQVLHVFVEGCALSKAGASTYYQNIKKGKKSLK